MEATGRRTPVFLLLTIEFCIIKASSLLDDSNHHKINGKRHNTSSNQSDLQLKNLPSESFDIGEHTFSWSIKAGESITNRPIWGSVKPYLATCAGLALVFMNADNFGRDKSHIDTRASDLHCERPAKDGPFGHWVDKLSSNAKCGVWMISVIIKITIEIHNHYFLF